MVEYLYKIEIDTESRRKAFQAMRREFLLNRVCEGEQNSNSDSSCHFLDLTGKCFQ